MWYAVITCFAHQSVIIRKSIYITYITLLWASIILGLNFSPAVSAQGQPGISSPAAGTEVNGVVSIFGTAVIEPFQRYELYIKQEPNGDDSYIYVSGGTQPVSNGQLGVIDTNAFAPGNYSIRLRVVKLDGNYAEFFAPNISFNQGPVATPTSSEPTATPIPTATFTPAPQPTPIVGQVTQPQVQTDTLADTPTPEPIAAVEISPADSGESESSAAQTVGDVAQSVSLPGGESTGNTVEVSGGITSQLGEAVGLDRLRSQFYSGMRYSAFAFLLVGLLFLGKRILHWMRAQL